MNARIIIRAFMAIVLISLIIFYDLLDYYILEFEIQFIICINNKI